MIPTVARFAAALRCTTPEEASLLDAGPDADLGVLSANCSLSAEWVLGIPRASLPTAGGEVRTHCWVLGRGDLSIAVPDCP